VWGEEVRNLQEKNANSTAGSREGTFPDTNLEKLKGKKRELCSQRKTYAGSNHGPPIKIETKELESK